MFLFKNTENLVKRIGMNMAVYGFAGVFIVMLLAVAVPEAIKNYAFILSAVFSFVAIIGSIIAVICFLGELINPRSPSISQKSLDEQERLEKIIKNSVLLFEEKDDWYDEKDYYHYFKMAYYLTPQNKLISQRTTGHYDGHSSMYGSQMIFRKTIAFSELNKAITKSTLPEAKRFEGITELNCREYITANGNGQYSPQKKSQTVVFKMITKDGITHAFSYCGETRYSPNRSSTSGYGSDDWFYLCKENNKYFLLLFTDNASCGTAWMCTELLEGDYDKLVKEGVNFWGGIAYSKERTKTYHIRLTDIDSVRHLLPTSSRCRKLTDDDYLKKKCLQQTSLTKQSS